MNRLLESLLKEEILIQKVQDKVKAEKERWPISNHIKESYLKIERVLLTHNNEFKVSIIIFKPQLTINQQQEN